MRRFLENLGFIAGAQVSVVSEISGNVIVQIKDSRVAISKKCVTKKNRGNLSASDKIDRVVTNRWLALPIFALYVGTRLVIHQEGGNNHRKSGSDSHRKRNNLFNDKKEAQRRALNLLRRKLLRMPLRLLPRGCVPGALNILVM